VVRRVAGGEYPVRSEVDAFKGPLVVRLDLTMADASAAADAAVVDLGAADSGVTADSGAMDADPVDAGPVDAAPADSGGFLGIACLATCGDQTCDDIEHCSCAECGCNPGCGDGDRAPAEACDDGNRVDDDLCSNSCALNDLVSTTTEARDNRMIFSMIGEDSFGLGWTKPVPVAEGGGAYLRRFHVSGVPLDADALFTGPDRVAIGIVPFAGGRTLTVFRGRGGVFGRMYAAQCSPDPLTADEGFFGAATFDYFDRAFAVPNQAGVLVVWSSKMLTSADTDGAAVYFRRFDDLGQPKEAAPVLVNTTFTGDQADARVAQLASGGFVIVWVDQGLDMKGRVFAADGTPISAEIALSTKQGDPLGPVRVAARPGGGFVAIWNERVAASKELMLRWFSEDGTPEGADIMANGQMPGGQGLGAVGVNAMDEVLVTWTDAGNCESGCSDEDGRGRLFASDKTPGAVMSFIDDVGSGPNTILPLPDGAFIVTMKGPMDRVLLRRVERD